MPEPRVSVLLPVHREPPEFLERSIGSVLAQTFRDLEVVLEGDGVEDRDAIRRLESFAAGDARVKLVLGPRRGLVPTLNAGLARCRGDYVARHDADDWSEPERLAAQVAVLDARPELGVVGTDVVRHREDGTRLWVSRYPRTPADVKAALDRETPFCQGATLFRRALAESVGGYREGIPTVEDYDFFGRLLAKADGANLARPLYHYRYRRGSLSGSGAREQVLWSHAVRLLREGRAADPAAARAAAESALAGPSFEYQARLWEGDRKLLAGSNRESLQAYGRGIGSAPWRLTGWVKFVRWLLYVPFPPARRLLFEGLPAMVAPVFRPPSRIPARIP